MSDSWMSAQAARNIEDVLDDYQSGPDGWRCTNDNCKEFYVTDGDVPSHWIQDAEIEECFCSVDCRNEWVATRQDERMTKTDLDDYDHWIMGLCLEPVEPKETK